MRLTVISSHVPPTPGGVSDYTAAWCRAVRHVGAFDITVVTSSPSPPVEGMTMEVIPDDWTRRGRHRLHAAVARSNPDVVVVQWAPYAYTRRGAGLPLALTLGETTKRLNVPLVVNAHELYLQWGAIRHRLPFSLAQRAAVAYLVATSAALVVTVASRQQVLRRVLVPFRHRIHLLPVGATIPPQPARPRWRDVHGIPADAVLLVCLGLGHPSFDTKALAAVLDSVQACRAGVRLVVAGGLRVDHPDVTHLGFVDGEEAAQLLAAADLFVLPLTDGASGRRTTLVSALAAGAPVLSTRGPDTDPDLFDPSAVRLTSAGDREAFASAAAVLVQDETARRELGRAGRDLYEREFSWSVLAERWAKLLVDVVTERRPSAGDELDVKGGARDDGPAAAEDLR